MGYKTFLYVNSEDNQKKMHFALFFIVGYIVASPFYFFPSGTPQIADMFVALGMLLCFMATIWTSPTFTIRHTYFLALAFALYTFLINTIYFIYLNDQYFLLSSFYYVYNVSMFIFISYVIRRDTERALKYIYIATAVIVVLQVLYLVIDPSMRGPRATGSFINPNQLSYWSWFCAAIIVVLKIKRGFTVLDLFLLLCIGYIQTMSLSKAGIICYLLILATLPFSSVLPRHYKLLFLSAIAAIGLFSVINLSASLQTLEDYENLNRAMLRLEDIGNEVDDSAEGRGYSRIYKNPEYLFFGAGEGGYYRFRTFSKALELHSGVGTILFSYGIIGMFLFLFLLYSVILRNDRYVFFLIGVVLLYGLVHQNIRFTHFWVFLGVCDGMRHLLLRDKNRKKMDKAIEIAQAQRLSQT
jgi:hypothetical protein